MQTLTGGNRDSLKLKLIQAGELKTRKWKCASSLPSLLGRHFAAVRATASLSCFPGRGTRRNASLPEPLLNGGYASGPAA